MLTSRDLPRVTEKVQNGVRLEVRASDDDVGKYVDGHMDDLPNFLSKSPKIQQSIKKAVVTAVDGMYVLQHFWATRVGSNAESKVPASSATSRLIGRQDESCRGSNGSRYTA